MPKIRTEISILFVANFLSDTLTLQTKKPEQGDKSAVATAAITNAPVLSAVFEIPRWSVHCYGLTMAKVHYILTNTRTYLHTYINTYIHAGIYVHTHLHTHIPKYKYIHSYVRSTYLHTYICTYIHT